MGEQKDPSSTIVPGLNMEIRRVEENIILGLDLDPYKQNISTLNVLQKEMEIRSRKIEDYLAMGFHCTPGEKDYIKDFSREMYIACLKSGKDINFQIIEDIHSGEDMSETTEIRSTYNLVDGHRVDVSLVNYKDSHGEISLCDILYNDHKVASLDNYDKKNRKCILALNCALKMLEDFDKATLDKKKTRQEAKRMQRIGWDVSIGLRNTEKG